MGRQSVLPVVVTGLFLALALEAGLGSLQSPVWRDRPEAAVGATTLGFALLWCATLFNCVLTATATSYCEDGDGLSQAREICRHCLATRYQRSQHCFWCGHCVKKHLFHVPFLGTCVGHDNERHCIRFLLYATLTSWAVVVLSSNVLYHDTLKHHDEEQRDLNFAKFVMPAFVLFTGSFETSWYDTHLAVVMRSYAAMGLFFAIALVWCLLLVGRGQTVAEFRRNSRPFNHGLVANFRLVFGAGGLLLWWLPCSPLSPATDGRSFEPHSVPAQRSAKSL